MGLSSAMTTALTGMTAAEVQIDVAGNNLANSQTVGFKASDVIFATQFLRTLNQGSQPTDTNGGTNPMQTGLGVQVAAITPNFSQGTIEVSSSSSDLAIQGDGFFIVEGGQGEPLYTRNGIFNTNSQNELVSSTGNRLLGFGVDEFYNLQTTRLVPLTIPLGSGAAAQATQNVYLNGNLTPTGDVADTAEVLDSDILGDGAIPRADVTANPTTVTSVAPSGADSLTGNYNYVVTYSGVGLPESRPSAPLPITLLASTAQLDDLPAIPVGPGIPAYTTINIYRNTQDSLDQYFLVGSGAPLGTYTDARSDLDISDSTGPGYRTLDMDGPKITNATLLTNVTRRTSLEYQNVFQVGELSYTGRKDGNALTPKTLSITAETTVGDYLQFLASASGIQTSPPGSLLPIPPSVNRIAGESGTLTSGASITSSGRMRLVSNNGTGNAVQIPSSSFQLLLPDGSTATPSLGFSSTQKAIGQSASSDFIVYDSLGIPLDVRLTTVLQSRDSSATTYRWFADSGGNDPAGADHRIAVGTGLISFDGEGNLIRAENPIVNIERNDYPSTNPLVFDLDFSQVTGFATLTSSIAASRQDGSAVGTLTNYSVGDGGEIAGVFSNGISRTLGQIRLARFANPTGLDQRGENLYGLGFNSGLPVQGNPGDMGLGNLVAGALELSNTDTGENLIDLMLASTQYRANSRVISTAQTLLDDLLNMRR
ncbi:MAG: flagellar hook-basal body complex protein [Pirellulaceae bacterium]